MQKIISKKLCGPRLPVLPLNTDSIAITELPLPSSLHFPLFAASLSSCLLKSGDEVKAGQPLCEVGGKKIQPSPVSGEVVVAYNGPDIRGDKSRPVVEIKPTPASSPVVFAPLAIEEISPDALKQRLEQAGVMANVSGVLRPLLEVICPGEQKIEGLIVLAMDREPGLNASVQLLRERGKDAALAAKLLGKLATVDALWLAVPTPLADQAASWLVEGVKILAIPPVYPESLDSRVVLRAKSPQAAVVEIETALAALDAVQLGRVQDQKIISVIGPQTEVIGNYRVAVGTRFKEIFAELGLELKEGDKVIAGGPMLGFAQYTLEGAVDYGVAGLILAPADSLNKWRNDPCINCGKCIDICPVNLQVQLLGRYSEFGLFEQAGELAVTQCINCGLCAVVCPAHRPLAQLITLARNELAGRRHKRLTTDNPALAMFGQKAKLTVGPGPHWRSRASVTQINLFFLLALLPTVVLGAIIHSFGARSVQLHSGFAPVNPILKILAVELGVSSGALWLLAISGMVLFAMGTALIVEYLCQLIMRQPYHATNLHGVLIGLLLVLLMPPSAPLWLVALGVALAIVIGKQIYGGIGGYPLHPALVGYLMLLLSWPQYLYPIGAGSLAAPHPAVVIATAIGGLVLALSGAIRLRISIGVILGVMIFTLVFHQRLDGGIVSQLVTGHVMLAAFFLATDATCSPANKTAAFLYGFGVGFLIMLIRAYGIWPDAVPFAVLLMNIVNPLADRLRPRVKQGALS